jgi:hypothetical protein
MKHGITFLTRVCATMRTMRSLAEPGKTERNVFESPAYLMWKHKGDNSLPRKQWFVEDVWTDALQDSRDMGKTGLFEAKSPRGE